MFGIIHFEIFVLTGILLNVTPGTDTMYIISRSVSQGKRAGIYSVLGVSTGTIIHTLLAAFGLSIILTKSVLLFNIIKILGAVYLAYLGINMLLKKTSLKEAETQKNVKLRKIYVQGIISNVMNPKVALFFLAFLPQFINTKDSSPIPFIILGLTFTLTGTIWCLLVANFASFTTKKLRKNANTATILNKLTGIVFIGMGLKLLKIKPS
ncbi:LysE family translocator [Bacillus sp. 03113]|uniref:LysE family translocator n=1 Tax=Bacillus sp. 03113 TaxID=2578211 RepID=UPI0011428BF9|nr:LysE family translocator [Bacillus sp. 03113]